MINSFPKKSVKWLIIGIATVSTIGIVCLVNPKAVVNTVKKTTSADNNNLTNISSTSNSQQNINSNEVISSDDCLSEINFVLPKNWSVDKSQKSEYKIIDEKGENVGLINAIEYTDDFDLLTQKPNHSSVTKDEYIDVPLGKCRLLTLDSDNGTAASGIVGTHDVYFAALSVKGKSIYIMSFTKNDKKPETKAQFIQILKGISYK